MSAVDTVGASISASAERLTRAQWASRSGAMPSKCRAPSNTVLPSQLPWSAARMIIASPSCHAPWK